MQDTKEQLYRQLSNKLGVTDAQFRSYVANRKYGFSSVALLRQEQAGPRMYPLSRKGELIVVEENNCATIYWSNNEQTSRKLLSEENSKNIIQYFAKVNEISEEGNAELISKDTALIEMIALQCNDCTKNNGWRKFLPDQPDFNNNQYMFSELVMYGDVDMVRGFLCKYPNINVNQYYLCGNYNYTALHIAAMNCNVEMVEFLLKNTKIDAGLQVGEYHPRVNVRDTDYIDYSAGTAADIAKNSSKSSLREDLISRQIVEMINQHVRDQVEKKNTDKPNIKIAKLFDSYAHPPLLSMNWVDGNLQKVADEISKELYKQPDWGFDLCLEYVNGVVSKIDQTENNPFKPFNGILMEIEKMRPPVGLEQNNAVGKGFSG